MLAQWLVTSVAHFSTGAGWGRVRRWKWAGRVQLAVQLGLPIETVLRGDWLLDLLSLALLLYLQLLAIRIVKQAEEEQGGAGVE